MLQQALKQILQFLATPTGNWVIFGLVSFVALAIVYNRKRQIPGLTVEVIPEDTWFINRDDNHRLAIVVSLHLINKSSAPIRIRKCKLSGYSPKPPPEQLLLQGHDTSVELTYPKHDLFVDVGAHPSEHTSEYVLNPYTEQRMWGFLPFRHCYNDEYASCTDCAQGCESEAQIYPDSCASQYGADSTLSRGSNAVVI